MTAAPPIAGWLYDLSGDPYWPIVFAVGALANWVFWIAKEKLAVTA